MNNPRSIRFQAAVIRHNISKEDDEIRREALRLAADNLERMAEAIPSIKALLELGGHKSEAERAGL